MSYSDVYVADLRRTILDVLNAADAEVSVALLRSSISCISAHRPGSNQLRMEINWLAQHGAVHRRKIDGVIDAVAITDRGVDLASDREKLTGVAARD